MSCTDRRKSKTGDRIMAAGLKIIYEPKGRAREYAPLALNIYTGCTHGCKYCYCAKMWKSDDFYKSAKPRRDLMKKVESDSILLEKEFGDKNPEILLSFSGDVYQPLEEKLRLTRRVIKTFIQYGLRFTILTKGGPVAQADFDLLADYPNCSFGTTLCFIYQDYADKWEPFSPTIKERAQAIKKAYDLGIKTWVSLEPVIDPKQAIRLVEVLHPIVAHWKVGKINHFPEYENLDWVSFREEIRRLFGRIGTSYYIKKSLTEL